jgi:hypothetical protein
MHLTAYPASLSLKMCTVSESLETHSNVADASKFIEHTTAGYVPLRNKCVLPALGKVNTRITVPLSDAVARRPPSCDIAMHAIADLCACTADTVCKSSVSKTIASPLGPG